MKKYVLWLFLALVGVTAFVLVSWDENVIAQEFGETDFDAELEEDVEIEVDEHTDIDEADDEQEEETDDASGEDASDKQPKK